MTSGRHCRTGSVLSLNGLAGLPAAFSASWSTLSAESDGPERALGFSFVAILCAAVLTYIADLLVKLYLQRHQPKQRFLLALLRLMTDAMAISIFMGVSHLILRASLQHGSFTREVAGALVATVNVVLIYAAIGRFFLRPSLPVQNRCCGSTIRTGISRCLSPMERLTLSPAILCGLQTSAWSRRMPRTAGCSLLYRYSPCLNSTGSSQDVRI